MQFLLTEALAVLERTPETLRSLLLGLPDAWLLAREGPDTFAPRDVLGHLIHGEETDWIPRTLTILEHGETVPFVPFDRFAFRHKYGGTPTPELLERFARLRRTNLDRLRALDLQPKDLQRRGTHPDFGPVTVEQLLATWVAHDLNHTFQIARVMAKEYSEAVGPWKVYLRILNL